MWVYNNIIWVFMRFVWVCKELGEFARGLWELVRRLFEFAMWVRKNIKTPITPTLCCLTWKRWERCGTIDPQCEKCCPAWNVGECVCLGPSLCKPIKPSILRNFTADAEPSISLYWEGVRDVDVGRCTSSRRLRIRNLPRTLQDTLEFREMVKRSIMLNSGWVNWIFSFVGRSMQSGNSTPQ